MSCPSNCHGTGTSKVVSWRSWPDTRFGCRGSPDRILHLSVNARQRPGGVAWDAVPLTVRGLNKAAGNPPLVFKLEVSEQYRSSGWPDFFVF